ncbi:hypothetical protein K2X85_03245 [bacterium]|nr:hypothetical protein [bacterium]
MNRRDFLGTSALFVAGSISHPPTTWGTVPSLDLSAAGLARWEVWLKSHANDRPLVVLVDGSISPVMNPDPRWAPLIDLFERFGVDEVIESSHRGPFRTPPIRVGQIDPAGIIYRSA